MGIHIYIYIYVERERGRDIHTHTHISLYIYIFICCFHLFIHTCIYIYIYRSLNCPHEPPLDHLSFVVKTRALEGEGETISMILESTRKGQINVILASKDKETLVENADILELQQCLPKPCDIGSDDVGRQDGRVEGRLLSTSLEWAIVLHHNIPYHVILYYMILVDSVCMYMYLSLSLSYICIYIYICIYVCIYVCIYAYIYRERERYRRRDRYRYSYRHRYRYRYRPRLGSTR